MEIYVWIEKQSNQVDVRLHLFIRFWMQVLVRTTQTQAVFSFLEWGSIAKGNNYKA